MVLVSLTNSEQPVQSVNDAVADAIPSLTTSTWVSVSQHTKETPPRSCAFIQFFYPFSSSLEPRKQTNFVLDFSFVTVRVQLFAVYTSCCQHSQLCRLRCCFNGGE